jgi:hypothetical protein
MIFKPAHKNLENPPGQIVNPIEGTPHHFGGRTDAPIDRLQTIGGIIDRVMRSEAKPIKKKMTFDEWWKSPNGQEWFNIISEQNEVVRMFEDCWKAAQENV